MNTLQEKWGQQMARKGLAQAELDQLRWKNEKLLEEIRRLRGEEVNIATELQRLPGGAAKVGR